MIAILEILVEIGVLIARNVSGAVSAFNAGKSIYDKVKSEDRDPTEAEINEVRALWTHLEADFYDDDEPLAPQADT